MATFNVVLLLDTINSSSEDESNAEFDNILAIIAANKKEKLKYWLSEITSDLGKNKVNLSFLHAR